MELILQGLALAALLSLFFGVVLGWLARRKGYGLLAWVGAGGLVVPATIALAWLPIANAPEFDAAKRRDLRAFGDRVGLIFTAIQFGLSLLAFFMLAMGMRAEAHWWSRIAEWPELIRASRALTIVAGVSFIAILVGYLVSPGKQRSGLALAGLTLLAVSLTSTAAAGLVWDFAVSGHDRRTEALELPLRVAFVVCQLLFDGGLVCLCFGVWRRPVVVPPPVIVKASI